MAAGTWHLLTELGFLVGAGVVAFGAVSAALPVLLQRLGRLPRDRADDLAGPILLLLTVAVLLFSAALAVEGIRY